MQYSEFSLLDAAVDATTVMAEYLYVQALENDWLSVDEHSLSCASIIVMSHQEDTFVARPEGSNASKIESIAACFEAESVMIMQSDVTHRIFERISPMSYHIALQCAGQIDVCDAVEDLVAQRRRRKTGFVLIRDLKAAVVWCDSARQLLEQGRRCDEILSSVTLAPADFLDEKWFYEVDVEKKVEATVSINIRETSSDNSSDVEGQSYEPRAARWIWPGMVAVTFILSGMLMGQLLSAVILATMRDGQFYQLVFVLYLPLACALSSFFLAMIVVGCFQMIGPITQMEGNSNSFSGTRTKVELDPGDLPHITIQCPVYKEDISEVLEPTFSSVQEAIITYEAQGGTASIIVHDDGMRLLDSAEQNARAQYFRQRRIGWTARPAHGANSYVRAGAFKKASNLNFGMQTSQKVEAAFTALDSDEKCPDRRYAQALQSVIDDSQGIITAGGDIGLGELILLIDADTRVPTDCFLDAVREFHETPSLALLQHPSGVLQVAHNFWETGLAHFTKNNYFGTRYVVSGGDTTPFFGHNAFLRLSAINDIAHTNAQDEQSWWSEEHVSEDFEMHLKLLCAGFTSRMAGYSNNEFKEGVSLTVLDEINRWEKYAFGISELIFFPVRLWPTRGPFTGLFRQFLLSDMDLSAKCSNLFYMFTYFGIGLSWLMCIINYFLVGWFPLLIRSYYVDCLQILVSVSIIFSLKDAFVGPFVRYRLREISLARGLLDSLKYFIIVNLFLHGISMHVSKCLIWHLCGFKMSWGATMKSVEDHATLRDDLPTIWSRYRIVYLTVFIMLATVLTLGFVAPVTYRIVNIKAVFPVLWLLFWHAMLPVVFHNRSFLAELYKPKLT